MRIFEEGTRMPYTSLSQHKARGRSHGSNTKVCKLLVLVPSIIQGLSTDMGSSMEAQLVHEVEAMAEW